MIAALAMSLGETSQGRVLVSHVDLLLLVAAAEREGLTAVVGRGDVAVEEGEDGALAAEQPGEVYETLEAVFQDAPSESESSLAHGEAQLWLGQP